MTSCVRNVHTSPRTPVNLVVPSDNKFHYDKSTEFGYRIFWIRVLVIRSCLEDS